MAALIARANPYLSLLGLGWLVPLAKIASGDDRKRQASELWRQLGVPLCAIAAFLLAWSFLAARIETSLGGIPGPAAVWREAGALVAEHRTERAKRAEFYARQDARNAAARAADPHADVRVRQYTGKPTYFDQILTSLATVFTGFALAVDAVTVSYTHLTLPTKRIV